METKSPWSTPTESEILNAEDSALIKEKEAALFEEIEETVNESFGASELGDVEPIIDDSIEDQRKYLSPSPTKTKSKKSVTNGLKEKARSNRSRSPAVDKKVRQKSISPTKKKRSPKVPKKKKMETPPDMEENNIEPDISNDIGSDNEVNENNERNRTATLSKETVEDEAPEDIMTAQENYNVSPVKRSTSKDSPKKKPNRKKNLSRENGRSPSPTKGVSRSPTKQRNLRANRQTSQTRTATANSAASGDSLKLGADYSNIGRPNEAGRSMGRMTNGRGSDDVYSANTNRSSSTATSGSTGGGVVQSKKQQSPPVSPKKSPTKSPKKNAGTWSPRKKMKDLLVLPMPYNDISSDEVKRWDKTLTGGGEIDEEIYPEFQQIEFTNALILKINQMSKQGLLERSILFNFACRIAKYEIEQKDVRKCMNSFFSYARQLQTLREGIKTDEQKEIFDMETASWIPPTLPRQTPYRQMRVRPKTPKPKDPDQYEFDDPELERDYRKMYDQLQEIEAEKAAALDEDDPNNIRKAMEAALLFGGAK